MVCSRGESLTTRTDQMKLFKATIVTAAFASLAAPVQAFGSTNCPGQGGFIQVGNQVECIRQLTSAEQDAFRVAAQIKASRRRSNIAAAQAEESAKQELKSWRQNVNSARKIRDAAADQMDLAADNIRQPGGRKAYRNALRDYSSAEANLIRLTR